MAFCKNCGKELKKGEKCSCEKDVKFCKSCGKKLVGNETCDCEKNNSASGSFDFVETMKNIKDDLLAVFKKPVTIIEENTKELDMPKTYISLAVLALAFGLFIAGIMKLLMTSIGSLFGSGLTGAVMSSAMDKIELPYFRIILIGAVIFAITILAYAVVMLLVPSIFKNKKLNFKETLTLTTTAYMPMVWVNVICALLGFMGLSGMFILIVYLVANLIVTYNFVYGYAKYTDIEANKFGYSIAVLIVLASILTGICTYALSNVMGDSISSGIEVDDLDLDDFDY